MEKKYELIKRDPIIIGCKILYRIKALKSFNDVKAGALGGYVEKEENLSHDGNCWVYGNAKIYDSAEISGNGNI